MDCVAGQTTIENRLGRAGGLGALRDSGLCPSQLPIPGFPILTRSAALLTLLLQDGTVDLELASSVIALDPGLAFGTLQVANLERNGEGQVWQLPLAVVAAGCDRLLMVVNMAMKVESSYDCGTSARLRQLYLRCVQRACIAELLTSLRGSADPKRSYVAGLLFCLPGMLGRKHAINPALSSKVLGALPDNLWIGSATTGEECDPIATSVLLANGVLELPEGEKLESSWQTQRLAESALWGSGDESTTRERCKLISQGCKLAKWAEANASRLSPWDFLSRLHRHKSWE
jgi:hypothetical protein